MLWWLSIACLFPVYVCAAYVRPVYVCAAYLRYELKSLVCFAVLCTNVMHRRLVQTIQTHTHTNTQTHTQTHAHTHTQTHTHTHTHTHKHAHIHAHIHTHAHTCKYTHAHKHSVHTSTLHINTQSKLQLHGTFTAPKLCHSHRWCCMCVTRKRLK